MRRVLIGFVSVALVLACGTIAVAQKVAVVDVIKIFNNCKKSKSLSKNLDAQRVVMEKEANTREKKITNTILRRDDQFKKGSPEFLRMTQEALKLQFDLKSYNAYSTQYLLIQHKIHTEQIYGEILEEIAKHATQHGFQLILALDNIKLKGSKNFREVAERIVQKKVLFHAKSIDLTATILRKVNDRYKAAP